MKRAEKEKSPKRHRQSKPFDTIEEEKEKIPKKQMQSKAVQVSRGFNETLTRIKPLSRVSSASSSESVSSTGRTRQSSHRSTVRSTERAVHDSSKCSRHNGHSSRSSHGSRSSRRTNSSSHDHSVEDVRAVVVAPHRSRRSNGTDERFVVVVSFFKLELGDKLNLNFIYFVENHKGESKEKLTTIEHLHHLVR